MATSIAVRVLHRSYKNWLKKKKNWLQKLATDSQEGMRSELEAFWPFSHLAWVAGSNLWRSTWTIIYNNNNNRRSELSSTNISRLSCENFIYLKTLEALPLSQLPTQFGPESRSWAWAWNTNRRLLNCFFKRCSATSLFPLEISKERSASKAESQRLVRKLCCF